jgi:hypothetical protein
MKFRHPTRAGLSEVPVLIVASLAILLLVPAAILYNQPDVELQKWNVLHNEIRRAEDADKAYTEQIAAMLAGPLTGLDPQSAEPPSAKRIGEAQKALEALRTGADPTAQRFWTDFVGEVKTDFADSPLTDAPPATLQQMAQAMIPYVERMQTIERTRRTPEATAQKRIDAVAAVAPKLPGPFAKIKADMDADLAKVEGAQTVEDDKHKKEIDGIAAETAQLEAELAEKKTAHELFMRDKKAEEEKAKGELAKFRSNETVSYARQTPVGEILKSTTDGRTAYIALGSRDRVTPGLRFQVGNRGLYGLVTDKGTVEVRQVWPEMAEVEVVKLANPRVPILAGDLLVNPFFHPRRPVVVQVVGSEQGGGEAKAAAIARIRAAGAIVRPRFAPDVDFLVKMTDQVDTPEDEDVEIAGLLDVPIFLIRDKRTDRPVFYPPDLMRFLED